MSAPAHAFLPQYRPPAGQRAAMAAGLAPLLVLVTFTLIVSGALAVDTGMALFAACTVWVMYELHAFQSGIDRYNASYAESNLAWRSSAMLKDLLDAPCADPDTREFVARFLAADRAVLRDGQLP